MNLVDTDVLIDIQRGHPPALAWFATLTELPAVPGFVVMELYQDARDAKELLRTTKMIAPFARVWPSESECERGLDEFRSFHLSHGLGPIDALIAGCVLGRAATLWTFNTKHFQPISGLSLAEPYTR